MSGVAEIYGEYRAEVDRLKLTRDSRDQIVLALVDSHGEILTTLATVDPEDKTIETNDVGGWVFNNDEY